MVKIADMRSYTAGMQKSIADKLWFMDEMSTDVENIYDFGCADGTLLAAVHGLEPSLSVFGYDMNEKMIQLAKANNLGGQIYNQPVRTLPDHTLLNASSVFHEIFSYGTPTSIRADHEAIFCSGAEYIAIRDMFFTESMPFATDRNQLRSVRNLTDYHRMMEFERIHGSMELSKNFLHYLLKYRYVENWQREVRENYLPNSIEQFIRNIPDTYEVKSLHIYTLPFLRQKVREDFGFWFDYPTHAKILLKRKSQ